MRCFTFRETPDTDADKCKRCVAEYITGHSNQAGWDFICSLCVRVCGCLCVLGKGWEPTYMPRKSKCVCVHRVSPCTWHLSDHSLFPYWSMQNMIFVPLWASAVEAALLCAGSCRLYCCHTLQRLPKSPPGVPARVYAFASAHVIFTYPHPTPLPAKRRAVRIVTERRYMQSAFPLRGTDPLMFPVFYLKVPPLKAVSLMHNVVLGRVSQKKYLSCSMSVVL